MLNIITKDFWPTSVANRELSTTLNRTSKFFETLMISFYLLITFCCCLLLVPPLYINERALPLASYFPFEWSATPIYEILYVWQWIVNLFGVCYVVGAHDFLFVGLMVNLIAQLELLKYGLTTIGTDQEHSFGDALMSSVGLNVWKREEGLLVTCVQHHRKLIA